MTTTLQKTQTLLLQVLEFQEQISTMKQDIYMPTHLIKTLDRIKQKRPIPIIIYQQKLIQIITKEKCIQIDCLRTAVYQNLNHKKEKYCWIHSQNIE